MQGHDGCGCGCGCGGDTGLQEGLDLGIDWARAPEDEVVCACAGVDKAGIRQAIEQGAYTLALVKILTGAGRDDACQEKNPRGRSCHADILELIRIYYHGPPPLGGGCGL